MFRGFKKEGRIHLDRISDTSEVLCNDGIFFVQRDCINHQNYEHGGYQTWGKNTIKSTHWDKRDPLHPLSPSLLEGGLRRRRPALSATAQESIGYPLLGPFLTSKEGT